MKIENLLLRVGRYCRANNMTEREFSRVISDDPKLMERARRGDRVRPITWVKIEKHLDDHGG